MGLLDGLKKKGEDKQAEIQKREEDYISLIRVYIQGFVAETFGISNINQMPDLRAFKVACKVPTMNGKLGLGERLEAKKMLSANYGLSDDFFKTINKSITKNCKNLQQVNSFFVVFQGFVQDFVQLLTTHLGYKLQMPKYFDGMIRKVVVDGVKDLMEKNDWDKLDAAQSAARLRENVNKLGYTQPWMVEFIYPFIMIAKGATTVKQ